MTTTLTALRRQIASAGDLKSVVRTMKASAASAIGQYEQSVAALADYALTVQRGLAVSLRAVDPHACQRSAANTEADAAVVNAIVFGSDQGLVGRFNERVVEHARAALSVPLGSSQTTVKVWAVGERVQARLIDAGVALEGAFSVPGSVALITPLVGQILLAIQHPDAGARRAVPQATLMLFYNRPGESGYTPVSQRLLPLDARWQHELACQAWPALPLPDLLGKAAPTLQAFIREHVFVSLFRASAESLASENASRLAAMQRAERNIGELLHALHINFHQLRQASIDEELFDVIAGFDALQSSH